jgi:RNA polymerase sigma factor (sigma-70 family)
VLPPSLLNESTMNEELDLLKAWAGGDRTAGATLVERHYDAIVRFFRNKAGDASDDLVQRTFLACAEGAAGFRGQGTVRAYLFGIARNVFHEHLRGRTRDGRPEPDFHESALADLAPGVSTLAARRADQRVLLHALQHIPVDLQVLLELYYWEDLSVDELAQVLEIPPGTVKSRLHRARELLREATAKVSATPDETRSARLLLEEWAQRVRAGGKGEGEGDKAGEGTSE